MKTILIILLSVTIFSSCNQPTHKEKKLTDGVWMLYNESIHNGNNNIRHMYTKEQSPSTIKFNIDGTIDFGGNEIVDDYIVKWEIANKGLDIFYIDHKDHWSFSLENNELVITIFEPMSSNYVLRNFLQEDGEWPDSMLVKAINSTKRY